MSDRMTDLEAMGEWRALLEELEKAASVSADPSEVSVLRVKAGQVLAERFLQQAKALKSFQEAFKANPKNQDALRLARDVYWDLGKPQMVLKLLDREIKMAGESAHGVSLLIERGDLVQMAGVLESGVAAEEAAKSYAEALQASGGKSDLARAGLEDVQVAEDAWKKHVASLATGGDLSRLVRAARIAMRFSEAEGVALFEKAYRQDPTDRRVAFEFETYQLRTGGPSSLQQMQQQLFAAAASGPGKAAAATAMASRWLGRQDLAAASELLAMALREDGGSDCAFAVLLEHWGPTDPRLVDMVVAIAARPDASPFVLAQAGTLAWQKQNHLEHARVILGALAQRFPSHPAVVAFHAGAPAPQSRPPSVAPVSARPVSAPPSEHPEPRAPSEAPQRAVSSAPAAPSSPAPAPASAAPPSSSAPASVAPAPVGDAAELRARAEKLESLKRYNEYVKTLVELARALTDKVERVETWAKAGDLYATRFANTAEAIKCYEALLADDADHPGALTYLRQAYEKRRDYEKLLGLMRRDAESLSGEARLAKLYEMAKLGSEKVKKPDVCIELWEAVRAEDPSNMEALTALGQFYERAKDYTSLASILEQEAELATDDNAKALILTKLAQTWGERLSNEDEAVRVWQQVLAITPSDRKAQEAVKKKYLAAGMWDELEALYADSGKWDEFIRLLEGQEAKETDAAAKVGILLKVAELWITQKGKIDRAARAYEKVLAVDADNQEAAKRVLPLYEQLNNPKGVVLAAEVRLRGAEVDAEERAVLLARAVDLYRSRLRDPERAFALLLEAIAVGADEAAIAAADDLALSLNAFDRLAAALTKGVQLAEQTGNWTDEERYRLRLASVLSARLNNADGGLEQLRAIVDRDPDHEQALLGLEELYRATGRVRELLDVYERRRDAITDPQARIPVLLGICRIHVEELGELEQAASVYAEILELEPGHRGALRALSDLQERRKDWPQLVETLLQRVELADDDAERVTIKLALGAAYEKMEEGTTALQAYREALLIDPSNPQGKGALERLMASESLQVEAATLLQDIYEGSREWEKLIQALEVLISSTQGTERVHLLRRLARVALDELRDPDRGFEALARALREEPSADELREELISVAEQNGLEERLSLALSKIAQGQDDAALAKQYWVRLSEVEARRGKGQAAAQALENVLRLDPADEYALTTLESLYRSAGNVAELILILGRRIDQATDPDVLVQRYLETAELYDTKLGRPTDAITALKEILLLEPAHLGALAGLERLYERQGSVQELVGNLETQREIATSSEAWTALSLRLAKLYEESLKRPDQSLEIYREILSRDPQNGSAIQCLERLFADPALNAQVAEVLEPTYEVLGESAKLVGVLEARLKAAAEPEQRATLLERILLLREDVLGDPVGALDAALGLLSDDPASEGARAQVVRLAAAARSVERVVSQLEKIAAGDVDPDVASSLLSTAAALCETELSDTARAVALYERVLEVVPHSLSALEALESLFRVHEKYADLAALLVRKAGSLEDTSAKKTVLYQASAIHEDVLEQPSKAIAALRLVLEVDPEDTRALDGLIKLHLQLGQWKELLEAYWKKADLISSAYDKKPIYYQIGAVYERELSDVENAIDTYQKVLELDPDDIQALGRLDVLYQRAENWLELLSVLAREVELAADTQESASYQYRIADVHEHHLRDAARAVELYREVLEAVPDHAATRAALERLSQEGDQALAASSALETVLEASGDWAGLTRALEAQVRHTSDPFARVELLHRIAKVHEERLGDFAAAFGAMCRAVSVEPLNELTLQQAERLAMALGQFRELATVYEKELAKLETPEQQGELGLRLAQLCESQLEDFGAAARHYRGVLAVNPENKDALSALDRLCLMGEAWEELADVLRRRMDVADDANEVRDLRLRLAEVQRDRLKDPRAAVDVYRDLLVADPDETDARLALEGMFAGGTLVKEVGSLLRPVYEQKADWEKLAGLLGTLLHAESDVTGRVDMALELAQVQEEKLLAPERALDTLLAGLLERPLEERLLVEVERVAASIDGGQDRLANGYADVLGQHQDKDVQLGIGTRLARLFEEQLGDVAKAEETYRYLLGVDPLEPTVLAELDRIYANVEQYEPLAEVLGQRVKVVADPGDRAELHCRWGEVLERLGRTSEAIAAYRPVLDELAPGSSVALTALERLYGAAGDAQALRKVLEAQLDSNNADFDEAEVSAKLAAVLGEQLGDYDRAVELYRRALDARGEDEVFLSGLAKIYEKTERWAEFADVLGRQSDAASDDASRIGALAARAEVYVSRLGRDDLALEDFERILEISPDEPHALTSVVAIWRKRNDAGELVRAIHLAIDRGQTTLGAAVIAELYRELGTTYQHVLGQPYDAVDAWRGLLSVQPGDLEAMASLELLLRQDERWVEVAELKLARAAALTETEAQVQEYLDAAALWLDPVGDTARAIDAYEKILALVPTHDKAFDALEGLYEASKRFESLVELLLARLDTREQTADRTALLRKISRAMEVGLEDKGQAFDALVNALELDARDPETIAGLERLAQVTNRWSELVQTVNGWLQAERDAQRKIVLCLRLAKWYGEDLNHPEYAQPYYQQILAIEPGNVAVLRQMASYYKKTGQRQLQGSTLHQALNVAVADEDRTDLLTDLGELYRQMGEAEQGLAHYRRALDIRPTHLPALEALERYYTEKSQHSELVEILLRKAGLDVPSEVALEAKLKAAVLLETALGQPAKAGELYRDVLEADQANLPSLRGLERVYTATRQFSDLVRVLEMELDVVTTERERVEALMKIGMIQETEFMKPDLAAVRYEQVAEVDPNSNLAFEGLERCYRRLRQWLDLVAAFERHAQAAEDRSTKIELLTAAAGVYADELHDLERAVDMYLGVLDIDDACIPALEALAKLYEKQEEPTRAIEYLTRVADLSPDGKQRVEMYYRIGRQLEEKLGDRGQAQERFEAALDLDPAHLPSLAALRTIAIDAAEWDRAARLLEQEAGYTELPRSKAKLLVELGRIQEDMLGEHDVALAALEQAIELDPESEDAAAPLVRHFVEHAQWQRALPLAELLARKGSKKDRAEQHRIQNQLGLVYYKVEQYPQALKAYQSAHQLDLTDRVTIRGLADVYFALGDWPGALSNYQKVLAGIGEDNPEERADIYQRLGAVKQNQGQVKQAIAYFQKALADNPAHLPTLEALVAVSETQKDFRQVCHYKRQILDSVVDGPERIKLLIEIADVWNEKENAPAKAIEALEEAAELDPQDRLILSRLIGLYPKTNQWDAMTDRLQTLVDMEQNPEFKVKYLFTMAQLYRDKLDDPMRAVALFGETLDLNPGFLEAFERIGKILTATKEWRELVRAYERMIQRIIGQGNTELEYKLFFDMGLLCRDRLENVDAAIAGFREAAARKPEDPQARLILGELYERLGKWDDAIAEYRALLSVDPTMVDIYRRIYSLQLEKQSYDEAWCVASVLSFFKVADEEEKRFYEDYRPAEAEKPTGVLDGRGWKLLFHEEQDRHLGAIFDAIHEAALMAKVDQIKGTEKAPVLDPRFRQDATSTVQFSRIFFWAAHHLGVGSPQLYVRSDQPGGLDAVAATPKTFVAGQTVLTGFSASDLKYYAGRKLAVMHGEHFIRALFPTVPELTVLLFAALRMVNPAAPVPPENQQQAAATAQALQRYMQPVNTERLRDAVKRFLAAGARANVKRWVQCADLTTARAGLLLAGEVDVARKILAAEPQLPGELPVQDKIKDLLQFTVSANYTELRRMLGLAIRVDSQG